MITAQTDLITENKLRGSEADHPEFFMGAQETETGGCFYRYDSRNKIRCKEDIQERGSCLACTGENCDTVSHCSNISNDCIDRKYAIIFIIKSGPYKNHRCVGIREEESEIQ